MLNLRTNAYYFGFWFTWVAFFPDTELYAVN